MENHQIPQQAPCCLKRCQGAEEPQEKSAIKSLTQKEPAASARLQDGIFGIFGDKLFLY